MKFITEDIRHSFQENDVLMRSVGGGPRASSAGTSATAAPRKEPAGRRAAERRDLRPAVRRHSREPDREAGVPVAAANSAGDPRPGESILEERSRAFVAFRRLRTLPFAP